MAYKLPRIVCLFSPTGDVLGSVKISCSGSCFISMATEMIFASRLVWTPLSVQIRFRATVAVSITLFLCTFWSIASEMINGNAKFRDAKKGDGNTCTELIPPCSSKKVMWLHITWLASRQISLHSLSVFKVFLYNCLPELSYTSAFPDSRHPPSGIQWLLLLFLVIFSASLSESDHFVLFDS